MPGINGLTVLKKLKAKFGDLTVVGFSGASTETTDELLDAGAVEVIRKPVGIKQLQGLLERRL